MTGLQKESNDYIVCNSDNNWNKIIDQMPVYYCLDCKKVIFSKDRDYGPICPPCKQKRKLKSK